MAVLAPEAPKAATLGVPDVVHAAIADIAKWEDGPDGSLYVYGRATTPEVDTDEQIVASDWSGKALQEWLKVAPALRVQHNGGAMPAGSGVAVEVNRDGDGAHWVKGKVDEPVAQKMVRLGHLRAFSVGIAKPVIERDVTGKARGGIIKGGRIVEVSLVDSPANRSCWLEMAKAGTGGQPVFTGTVHAPDDLIAKVSGLTSVELPSDMKLKVTPATLAKMATLKRDLVMREQAVKAAGHGFRDDPARITPPVAPLTDAQDDLLTVAAKAAEAPIYKRDIDTATRRRLASEGRALPNLSYPVETHEDADNAVTLILSGHGDVKAATRMVKRIARKEGWKDVLKRLAGKGGKASKAAAPDVAKCGTCGGSGMHDGKPCGDCRKGRKASRRTAKQAAAQAAKKRKVMCMSCGAKQNRAHDHCSECGTGLAGNSAAVMKGHAGPAAVKNHDFACLGCGRDLDKGERHCPGCGRENPGFNAMADLKIPANKAAKERVGKKAEKGRKRRKGRKGRGDERDMRAGREAESGGDSPATKGRKGKGKGRSPAAGVKGQHTMGLPPHREPDGPPVEMFEQTARLQDGDEAREMAAAMHRKSLRIEPHLADLHDLTCAAYSPQAVARDVPGASFAGIDTGYWQRKATEAAASPDWPAALDAYNAAAALSKAAMMLKNADAQALQEVRLEQHQAFLKANADLLAKAFRDATPGPGTAPTPGHAMPGQFRRPYISSGHAADSPQAGPERSFPVPHGTPEAQDYTRGYITGDHAADSPDNSPHRSEPVPAGSAGRPGRVFYSNMMRDDYTQAVRTMHDHLSRIAPGICPMSPPVEDVQKPGRPVPAGVGAPEPHRGKSAKAKKAKARKAAKAKARKQARAAAAKRARVQRDVLKGRTGIDEGRARLGLAPFGLPETSAAPEVTSPAPDAAVLAEAVKAALAPIVKRQKASDKRQRAQRKLIDRMADQPDTRTAPFRGGGALKQASAAPAGPLTAAQSAEQAQAAKLQRLYKQYRESWNPVEREAARRELTERLGINPMTGEPDITHPFRT